MINAASTLLFTKLFNDAGNWGGTPLLDISKEQRGNLTNLKKLGLITSFKDEGDAFAQFTNAGIVFAASLGLKTPNWQ